MILGKCRNELSPAPGAQLQASDLKVFERDGPDTPSHCGASKCARHTARNCETQPHEREGPQDSAERHSTASLHHLPELSFNGIDQPFRCFSIVEVEQIDQFN
jgi:hypothetical protein